MNKEMALMCELLGTGCLLARRPVRIRLLAGKFMDSFNRWRFKGKRLMLF